MSKLLNERGVVTLGETHPSFDFVKYRYQGQEVIAKVYGLHEANRVLFPNGAGYDSIYGFRLPNPHRKNAYKNCKVLVSKGLNGIFYISVPAFVPHLEALQPRFKKADNVFESPLNIVPIIGNTLDLTRAQLLPEIDVEQVEEELLFYGKGAQIA